MAEVDGRSEAGSAGCGLLDVRILPGAHCPNGLAAVKNDQRIHGLPKLRKTQ